MLYFWTLSKNPLKNVLRFPQKRNQQNTVVDIDNNKNMY